MDADKEFFNFTLGITSNLDFSKPLNLLLAQRRIRQMHAHSVAGYKSNWWGRGQRPNFWTFSLHLHVGKAKNPSLVRGKHSEKAAKWSTRWRKIHSELDEQENALHLCTEGEREGEFNAQHLRSVIHGSPIEKTSLSVDDRRYLFLQLRLVQATPAPSLTLTSKQATLLPPLKLSRAGVGRLSSLY